MRKLKNWIDGFMEFTEGKGSPKLYRLWAAIFVVSAALERKTWITTAKGRQYPNQYILFVGPAGIGKSLATHTAYDLLQSIRTPETPFHLAPTSVTKASLIDALNGAERRIVRPMETPAVVKFNSLTVIANEFGVFLPAWDGEFMATLTDLWDCKRYAETRRTVKINIAIDEPQLSILSATTPAHMTGLLPEGAWEQGFMSRMLVVYSGEILHTDIFAEFDKHDELWNKLVDDLKDIYSMYGAMEVTDEAKQAITEWARAGGPPVPDHPKLHSYLSRRLAHLLKLCIIAAAASDSDRTITIDHYAEALDWLSELETYMPDVFKSMKSGGDMRAMEDCWHYAYQTFMKTKAIIPEHRLYAFLQERVPAHNIERILDVMCRARLLEKKYDATGGLGYEPKTRQP